MVESSYHDPKPLPLHPKTQNYYLEPFLHSLLAAGMLNEAVLSEVMAKGSIYTVHDYAVVR